MLFLFYVYFILYLFCNKLKQSMFNALHKILLILPYKYKYKLNCIFLDGKEL